MNERYQKKIVFTAAIFILLLSLALRVNAPSADLPSHITFSGSILTDEGNQCHNSRSKALYGEWFPDDWRITNYNPILPYIKYFVFKLFGAGLFQMRLVNYLFAFLSLLFFFLTLKSYFQRNPLFALLGTFFLGINFLYVMYNKIGTFETSITFWVILTLYFLEKYRAGKKSVFLLLTGVSTFMTFIFKSIMAYILPLPFAAFILIHLFDSEKTKIPLKKSAQHILFIFLGVLILFIPWYLFHYLPNREWIIGAAGQYMGKLMFPHGVDAAFRNFLSFPWKNQFYKIPMVWLSAVLFIPLFFRRLTAKKANLTEIGYTLFFFAHTAVFFVISYRPTRYFIPVIPAMVFMTTVLFERWYLYSSSMSKGEVTSFGPVKKSILLVIDVLWLSLAAYFCLIPLYSRYIHAIPRPGLSVYYFIISALLVALFYFIKNRCLTFPREKLNTRYILLPLIGIMAAISLFINFKYYLQWNADKTYTIRNISRDLGEKLENAYIGGMTSTVAVLENRHRALWLYPNFVNWDKHTFEKYPLTHALLGTDVSREIIHFFNRWPERMNRAALLKVYHIKDYFLHLYSFVDPYIKDCQKLGDGNYRLSIINPSSRVIKTKVLWCPCPPVAKDKSPDILFELKSGENSIVVRPEQAFVGNASSLLFFLDYPRSFGNAALRYEGENFHGKTGSNRKESSASNGSVRYFESGKNSPGFLSYGPGVPYSPGYLIVDFKLKFDNLKTKLRPLCRLDIYSYRAKGPVAERIIRPADIKGNTTGIYRLSAAIPQTAGLEFRVQAEKWADISFDYVDLTYYQGYFTQLSP